MKYIKPPKEAVWAFIIENSLNTAKNITYNKLGYKKSRRIIPAANVC